MAKSSRASPKEPVSDEALKSAEALTQATATREQELHTREQAIADALGVPVQLKYGSDESGHAHLTINYQNVDQLDWLNKVLVGDQSEEESKLWARDGLGERIQKARTAAGLSIDDVSNALKITSSAVRQWELGRKFPSRTRLAAFATLTGTDLGWLQTAVSDAARLIDEAGRTLGSPAPILERHQIINLELPFADDFLKRTPWLWPSYPCSDLTFAFKVFDDKNAPEFQIGDLVAVDPKIEAEPGDMVIAVINGQLIFGKYGLRGLGDSEARQLLEQFRKRTLDAVDRLRSVAGEEETRSFLQGMIREMEQSIAAGEKGGERIQIIPLRAECPPVLLGSGDIVGTMLQHIRPRRITPSSAVLSRP